jgi:hypothetical protein
MKRFLGIVAGALLLSVVSEGTASAAPIRLRIEDVGLGLGATLTDNGPGDVNPVVGGVTFSGAIGPNFIVNVTTGTSTPLIGGVGDFGQIDLNSVNVATTGGGTLRITLENLGFVGPLTPLTAQGVIGGTLTAPAGSTVLAQSWANGDNVVPALGPDQPPGPILLIGGIPAGSLPIWTPPGVMFGPGAFSSQSSGVFNNGAVDTFSLFAQVVITFSGPGSVSFDTNVRAVEAVTAVPEPTSLLLLSTGISLCGYIWRRKRSITQL